VSRVFLDTNLWIYIVEDAGDLSRHARDLVLRAAERRDTLLTSTMTVGEVLTKPRELKLHALAGRYRSLLASPGVIVLPFDIDCAELYADLRADRTIKSPDAIQLACAAKARCDLFITNDERLSRKIVPGIQFISSMARVFL
jgi:predicted nucleic acid-binding protein